MKSPYLKMTLLMVGLLFLAFLMGWLTLFIKAKNKSENQVQEDKGGIVFTQDTFERPEVINYFIPAKELHIFMPVDGENRKVIKITKDAIYTTLRIEEVSEIEGEE